MAISTQFSKKSMTRLIQLAERDFTNSMGRAPDREDLILIRENLKDPIYCNRLKELVSFSWKKGLYAKQLTLF